MSFIISIKFWHSACKWLPLNVLRLVLYSKLEMRFHFTKVKRLSLEDFLSSYEDRILKNLWRQHGNIQPPFALNVFRFLQESQLRCPCKTICIKKNTVLTGPVKNVFYWKIFAVQLFQPNLQAVVQTGLSIFSVNSIKH